MTQAALQTPGISRLNTNKLLLLNPVICGSGKPVMIESGIRAALQAGAAGVIAKSVNEHPAGGRQLDRADYVRLGATEVPTAGPGGSSFNR